MCIRDSVCTCKNTCSIFTAVPVHPLDNSGRMTLSSSVSVIIKDPGQEHTVNPDPSVPEVTAPPAEQAPPSNEPVPGSSNGNGAVYDPVFGWVVPGNVQQSTGDSDGDLNKQVGNMG